MGHRTLSKLARVPALALSATLAAACGFGFPVAPAAVAQGTDAPAATAPASSEPAAVTPAPAPPTTTTAAPAAGPAAPAVAAETPATKPQTPRQQAAKPRTAAAPAGSSSKSPIKEPVTSSDCRAAAQPGKPYFVEFRSRTAASYGHTFLFYGRTGTGKGFASFKVAGLHPKGDDPAVYIQGHWMPVPAETGASDGDLDEQYLTARFCVPLTEAEYKKAQAFIVNLQATSKTWHALTFNCNSFAAEVAKSVGLKVPNPNMYLPEEFIKQLAGMNKARAAPAPLARSATGGTSSQ